MRLSIPPQALYVRCLYGWGQGTKQSLVTFVDVNALNLRSTPGNLYIFEMEFDHRAKYFGFINS